MEQKKYPKKDINRNSHLYFSLGLTAVLLLTYVALEWKTYTENDSWDSGALFQDNTLEYIPITKQEPKLKPKEIKHTPIIEVAEDDDQVEETFIASTESDLDAEVVAIDSIAVMEESEDEIIPFVLIEEVPVFPGCEDRQDKRACFQTMMIDHVKKNFSYPESAVQMGLEGRVYVSFTIEKDGSIGDIRMRGPDKILEKEAARIIRKLPKMTPGKQRGKEVRVPFTLPVYFRLH
jgi:protein TonB